MKDRQLSTLRSLGYQDGAVGGDGGVMDRDESRVPLSAAVESDDDEIKGDGRGIASWLIVQTERPHLVRNTKLFIADDFSGYLRMYS